MSVIFVIGISAAAIKEGNWSMTTVIRMEGMDAESTQAMQEMENMSPAEKAMMEKMMGGMGMKMGPQGGGMGMSMTRTQCITNDNPVPEGDDQEDCQQTHTMQGNTVNFEVTCDDSHSTGQVTYKNDSMKGTINSTQTENGQEKNVIIDISGEYVGPCDQVDASPNGMSDKEFAMKQRALDLKRQELELKKQEMELEQASNSKNPSPKGAKSKLDDVNNAVNTTNNVKNTFDGLRSLLGR